MKKKFAYAACAIFIAIAFMIIFVLSRKDTNQKSTINLEGIWRAAVSVDNKSVTFKNDEFMVFDTENAYGYKDNDEEPYASSKYKIETGKDNVLQLPDISRKYIIDMKSNNCILQRCC